MAKTTIDIVNDLIRINKKLGELDIPIEQRLPIEMIKLEISQVAKDITKNAIKRETMFGEILKLDGAQ